MKKLFFSFLSVFFTLGMASLTFAQAEGATVVAASFDIGKLSAAIAIGLAVIGGALGQARAAAAALEGIARNPGASGKVFAPFILAMALIESLVIFALLIAFVVIG